MNSETSTPMVEPIAAEAPESPGFFRKWVPLLVMSLALVIMLLDTTILNVTMGTIIVDLDTTLQKFQWVVTAYSLMMASFTITGGRLGDIFGRKKTFVIGAIIFALGSFITSISQTVGVMIIGEAIIAGAGAALMLPATATLLRTSYQGHDRRLAFGVWGAIAAAAAALGPLVGGWLTTNYSWRWAFRINVFIVLLLVLGSRLIRETRDSNKNPTLDWVGVGLSAFGLFCLVFGFIEASTYGWLHEKQPFSVFGREFQLGGYSATPMFIAIGILVLALFAFWQNHMRLSGRAPLVSLKLFRNTLFVTGTSISAIIALGQAGLSFSVPVYLQAVLKLDPIHTGLAMIPLTASILVAAPFSAILSKHVAPRHIIQVGIVTDAAGFLVMRHSLHVGASPWDLAPGMCLFGVGMGLMIAQTSNLALSSVAAEETGEASGVNTSMRLTGSALGSAILGAVMISALAANLVHGVGTSAIIPENLKAPISKAVETRTSAFEFGGGDSIKESGLSAPIKEELSALSNRATVDAGRTALAYGAALVLSALLVSTRLPRTNTIENERLAA